MEMNKRQNILEQKRPIETNEMERNYNRNHQQTACEINF